MREADRAAGLVDAMYAAAAGVAALPPPPRLTLIHCDFALRNLLVAADGTSVTGLIDFATALVGDPLYDLARLTWADLGADEPRARAALLRGWSEAATSAAPPGSATLRLYEAIQGLAAVAWADRRGGHDAFRDAGRAALLALVSAHSAPSTTRSPC